MNLLLFQFHSILQLFPLIRLPFKTQQRVIRKLLFYVRFTLRYFDRFLAAILRPRTRDRHWIRSPQIQRDHTQSEIMIKATRTPEMLKNTLNLQFLLFSYSCFMSLAKLLVMQSIFQRSLHNLETLQSNSGRNNLKFESTLEGKRS